MKRSPTAAAAAAAAVAVAAAAAATPTAQRAKPAQPDRRKEAASVVGNEIKLLCCSVNLELFLAKGPGKLLETYHRIRKRAELYQLGNRVDLYFSKLIVVKLFNATHADMNTMLVKAIISLCNNYSVFRMYALTEISRRIDARNAAKTVTACYLLLRICMACAGEEILDSRLFILSQLFSRFIPELNGNVQIAALLRAIRHMLLTESGDLDWNLAIKLHHHGILDKVKHPLLNSIREDFQARVEGVLNLFHGLGTGMLLCPVFGVSPIAHIQKIYTSRRSAKDPQHYKSLIFTMINLLNDRAPVEIVCQKDFLAQAADHAISGKSSGGADGHSTAPTPSYLKLRKSQLCNAVVQRVIALIYNTSRPGHPILSEEWLELAGQVHGLIHLHVISFREIVESLYSQMYKRKQDYRDNRVIWLLSQCMTLEEAKTTLGRSIKMEDSMLIRHIEHFYNHSVYHENSRKVQQQLMQPTQSQTSDGGYYKRPQEQRLDRMMSIIYDLSIQPMLFRIQYLEKKFKFRDRAREIKCDEYLVEWWGKEEIDFYSLSDPLLVRLALLSSMSSAEVSSRISHYLVGQSGTTTIMPGQLFVSTRLDPLHDNLLAILSEGSKKHLRKALGESLLKGCGDTAEAPSPALVLTYSKLLRTSPFFSIQQILELLNRSLSGLGDEKQGFRGSAPAVGTSNPLAGKKQKLRHVMLELLAMPLFRFVIHCGDATEKIFQLIGKMSHTRLHPQVALQLQHVLPNLASYIAYCPPKGLNSFPGIGGAHSRPLSGTNLTLQRGGQQPALSNATTGSGLGRGLSIGHNSQGSGFGMGNSPFTGSYKAGRDTDHSTMMMTMMGANSSGSNTPTGYSIPGNQTSASKKRKRIKDERKTCIKTESPAIPSTDSISPGKALLPRSLLASATHSTVQAVKDKSKFLKAMMDKKTEPGSLELLGLGLDLDVAMRFGGINPNREIMAMKNRTQSFGIITDRALMRSFARAIRLPSTRSRTHLNMDLSSTYASLVVKRGAKVNRQSSSLNNNGNETIHGSSSNGTSKNGNPEAKENAGVAGENVNSRKEKGMGTLLSSKDQMQLEGFLTWYETLPHFKRSFSAKTLNYFPKCLRDRLLSREAVTQWENGSPQAGGSSSSIIAGSHRKLSSHGNSRINKPSRINTGIEDVLFESPLFMTWSDAIEESKREHLQQLLVQIQRGPNILENAHRYYDPVIADEIKRCAKSKRKQGGMGVSKGNSSKSTSAIKRAEQEQRQRIDRIIGLVGKAAGLTTGAEKACLDIIRSRRRRLFLPAVAACWVRLNDISQLNDFRSSHVIAVLQRFTPADVQASSCAFVDSILDFIRLNYNSNMAKVIPLVWAMLQSSIVQFDHILTHLAECDSDPNALNLATQILFDSHHSGLVARRNRIVKLVKNHLEGHLRKHKKMNAKSQQLDPELDEFGNPLFPTPGNGLPFRLHVAYHQGFRDEIPSIFNENGIRVAGEKAIIAMYHSNSTARCIPCIDLLFHRLIENGRRDEILKMVELTWPLYHLFHPTPATFISEVLNYYDGAPDLDIEVRMTLLRLVPPPGPCSINVQQEDNMRPMLNDVWKNAFPFLTATHFGERKRCDVTQATDYPEPGVGRSGSLNADGGGLPSFNMSANDGGFSEDDWQGFLNDDDPTEMTKTEEKAPEVKDEKGQSDEFVGRILDFEKEISSSSGVTKEGADSNTSVSINQEVRTKRRKYLRTIGCHLAELTPFAHPQSAKLSIPTCTFEQEFVSPLRRAVCFSCLELLSQVDKERDPSHQGLAHLFLDTFIFHNSEDKELVTYKDQKSALASGSKDSLNEVHGAGLLITALPARFNDTLIALILKIFIPPSIFPAARRQPSDSDTKEQPYLTSQCSTGIHMTPEGAAAALRRKRAKRKAYFNSLRTGKRRIGKLGTGALSSATSKFSGTSNKGKSSMETVNNCNEPSNVFKPLEYRFNEGILKDVETWRELLWDPAYNAIVPGLGTRGPPVSAFDTKASQQLGESGSARYLQSFYGLPSLEKLMSVPMGPIEGGLFPAFSGPSMQSAAKTASSNRASPRSSMATILVNPPDQQNSALGRMMTLLETIFTWGSQRFFAQLCRGVISVLRDHINQIEDRPENTKTWTDAQVAQIVPIVQVMAFGFSKFKSDRSVVESLIIATFLLIAALSKALDRRQARDALPRIRVVFDFAIYLATAAKYKSKACEREIRALVGSLHPEWKKAFEQPCLS
mmetsp:Transcript_7698/g.18785  ORF Transcript_7698/g.18785 Transcript_7698/m.18785 type:complete len:2220 (-) Transcript_7698:85-6744(-)